MSCASSGKRPSLLRATVKWRALGFSPALRVIQPVLQIPLMDWPLTPSILLQGTLPGLVVIEIELVCL